MGVAALIVIALGRRLRAFRGGEAQRGHRGAGGGHCRNDQARGASPDLAELVLPGNIQANYEAPIYARTSGYLKRWLVDIGTPVKAGQLLGEIESPEVDQQLRQAQADLATAEANQKIADLTAQRWRDLRASDSVSKQEADEKIASAASGDAQMQSARANVQRLQGAFGLREDRRPLRRCRDREEHRHRPAHCRRREHRSGVIPGC